MTCLNHFLGNLPDSNPRSLGGVLGGMRCQDGFKMTKKKGGVILTTYQKNWDDPSSRNPTYNNNNNNNNNNIIGS